MKLIGVGLGGAFTDVVSIDTERDEIVYHGLTVATNALLEHKRARTGVVTRGYSSIIRESEDFGATLVDVENRQLAEAPRSTPLQSGPTPAYVHGMRRQLYERGECNRRVWNLPRSKLRLSDLVSGTSRRRSRRPHRRPALSGSDQPVRARHGERTRRGALPEVRALERRRVSRGHRARERRALSRYLNVAGAQLGPIARDEIREQVVRRLVELPRQAKDRGSQLVVFPELALTTFFPRWWLEDPAELDAFFEREMPSKATRPLFEEARRLGLGFYLGYAELEVERRYNTSILVDAKGALVGKYRKVHLPGHADHQPELPYQHLEKRYFDVGDLGFRVWRAFGGVVGMMICNDRRWPEAYRVMALQGVEMILLGYNTPAGVPWEPMYDDLSYFHNHLVMQAGAYQNNTWVVGVAKAGKEEGCDLIGGSAIIAPSGELVAVAATKDDELLATRCDLDLCAYNHRALFNFEENGRIEHYRIITEQRGARPPGDSASDRVGRASRPSRVDKN